MTSTEYVIEYFSAKCLRAPPAILGVGCKRVRGDQSRMSYGTSGHLSWSWVALLVGFNNAPGVHTR
jgi:hypothetical protein